jgi:hypothetical protein
MLALLLSLFLGGFAHAEAAQRGAAPPPARSGIAMTVTDPVGGRLEGVEVELLGLSDRRGHTDPNGQINFPSLQAGTYRLRFSGGEVIAFEREVTLRAGQVTTVDVTLNRVPPAPPPLEPPAPVEAPPPVTAVLGQPRMFSIVDLLEQEFIGRQPRRESLLSCSGELRASMIQLNDPMPERLYDEADAVYYVLGGQGTIRLNGLETRLDTNGFASVPRGTLHSFERRGNRALVLLAILGGSPCEEAK